MRVEASLFLPTRIPRPLPAFCAAAVPAMVQGPARGGLVDESPAGKFLPAETVGQPSAARSERAQAERIARAVSG